MELNEEGKVIFQLKRYPKKDQATRKSGYYWVPHQMEEITSRRFDMGRWVLHTEASTTNQGWGQHLFEEEGHVKS